MINILCSVRTIIIKRQSRFIQINVVYWYFSYCCLIIGLILSQFENRVPLRPLLGGGRVRGQCCTITVLQMNRFNETEAASFVSLECFCFQKIFIQNLFYVACNVHENKLKSSYGLNCFIYIS